MIRPFVIAALLGVIAAFFGSLVSCSSPQESVSPKLDEPTEPYPLSEEMAQLERDVTSEEYRELLSSDGMNIHDMTAEAGRLRLGDSSAAFLDLHGGTAAVQKDPELVAAYERRKEIEDGYVTLLRAEYKRRDKVEWGEARIAGALAATSATPELAERESVAEEIEGGVKIEPVLPSPEAAKYWPRWRGPTGQGISNETGLATTWSATENVVWKTPVPGDGNSSPVIWDDKIFLTSSFDEGHRRALIAFRRDDGRQLWMSEAPRPESLEDVFDKTGYAPCTPVTDGEVIACFFGNTGLVGFDLDGNRLWHYPMNIFNGSHGPGSSPSMWNDLVILFQQSNGTHSIRVALDKKTGEKRWSFEDPPALGWGMAIPLHIGDRDELLWAGSGRVVSFDPSSGKELWSLRGTTGEVVPSILYGNGLLYSSSGRNGPTLAIRPGETGDVTGTHLVWKTKRGGPHVPTPVVVDDLYYITNDTGIATCIDALTGEVAYQKRLKHKFTSSPLAADGKVYMTNERGVTYVIRQGREFEILAVNSIDEPVLASMAVLDGRIYLRGKQHLFAISDGD